MQQIASGTQVIHFKGGPKMRVRWYVDETHVETSWYRDSVQVSNVFNVNELEIWDDMNAAQIEVLDFVVVKKS